jgi:hypothetical protein
MTSNGWPTGVLYGRGPCGVETELDAMASTLALFPGLRQQIHDRAVDLLGDPLAVVATRRVTSAVLQAIAQAAAELADLAEVQEMGNT